MPLISRQLPQHKGPVRTTKPIHSTRQINAMPATRQDLFEHLAALGIETKTVEHPPLFTVEESSEATRDLPGGHTKNLFLKDDLGEMYLVVAKTTTKVDLKSLSKTLGAGRFSFGKPELMLEVLGISPGSVTAFSVMNPSSKRLKKVVIDAELMKEASINCHPLENTATTNIARDDLLRFIREAGHQPRIADLSKGT
jgi:Ala-tRNA(Pro) deacylase